ncbi:hypothetical protein [Vibrio parahaemolyticus]|uniref:hypothetical protein n=1 Tax=Vibrio parahaemolyticus TaxID=670 RepID=UPI0023EBCC3C|nr:hypothetical protein [Vibrio parahaemolyticus]
MITKYAQFSHNHPAIHLGIVALTLGGIVVLMAFTFAYESLKGLMAMPLAILLLIFFGKAASFRAIFLPR